MYNGHCDRCGKPTTTFRMSIYNTEMCCKDCIKEEESREDYKRAREIERLEVLRGNRNFKGVGL
jgi:recombinational DNA repair protein (RecF pathway)